MIRRLQSVTRIGTEIDVADSGHYKIRKLTQVRPHLEHNPTSRQNFTAL